MQTDLEPVQSIKSKSTSSQGNANVEIGGRELKKEVILFLLLVFKAFNKVGNYTIRKRNKNMLMPIMSDEKVCKILCI